MAGSLGTATVRGRAGPRGDRRAETDGGRGVGTAVVLYGTTYGPTSVALSLVELLRDEGDLEPVALAVDGPFVAESRAAADEVGLPLVSFADLPDRFPPSACRVLVPLGKRGMMDVRRGLCERARADGYTLAAWVSRRAQVWSRLEVGPNTMVFPGVTVMPWARLAHDVQVRANAVIAHHVEVGPHVTVANGVSTGGSSTIGAHSWVGLGAVVRDGVTLAERTFVGAGAVVVADTEPDGVYVGVPARRLPDVSATARSRA